MYKNASCLYDIEQFHLIVQINEINKRQISQDLCFHYLR